MAYGPGWDAQVGDQLLSNSRLWNLEVFADRHRKLWGPGNIMPEEWPSQNVHSDDEAARREGLTHAVGSAPQVISQIHRMMFQSFGAGWIAGGEIAVKMIKPVLVDDFTTARGEVTGVEAEGETHRIQCQVWVEKLGGARILVGSASAVIPKP